MPSKLSVYFCCLGLLSACVERADRVRPARPATSLHLGQSEWTPPAPGHGPPQQTLHFERATLPAPAGISLTPQSVLAAAPEGGAWLAYLAHVPSTSRRISLVIQRFAQDGAAQPARMVGPLNGAPVAVAIAAREHELLALTAHAAGSDEVMLYAQHLVHDGAKVRGILAPMAVFSYRPIDHVLTRGVPSLRVLSVVATARGYTLMMPSSLAPCVELPRLTVPCAPVRTVQWQDEDRFAPSETERAVIDDERPAILSVFADQTTQQFFRSVSSPSLRVVGDGPLRALSVPSSLRPLVAFASPQGAALLSSSVDARGRRVLQVSSVREGASETVPARSVAMRCEEGKPVVSVMTSARTYTIASDSPAFSLMTSLSLTVTQWPGSDLVESPPTVRDFDPVQSAVWTGGVLLTLRRSASLALQRCEGLRLSAPAAHAITW
ncbi:MAG: hypothetical protein Q8Q09_14300 [Deltaproteobacteria bacterium]|nr:hypothetical protein [Deltaproteobacteria bacterium]